jgi:hypothetical protein
VWDNRPAVTIDRQEMHEQVRAARTHMLANDDARGASADTIERLAIERTLINKGLLRRAKGGWC